MKVYLKIHRHNDMVTIACCDEELLNKIITEGNLRLEILEESF